MRWLMVVDNSDRHSQTSRHRLPSGRRSPVDNATRAGCTVRPAGETSEARGCRGHRWRHESSFSNGRPVWEHRFSVKAKFCEIGDSTLAIMKRRGHFETLDLQSGKVSVFPQIPNDFRVGRQRVTVLPNVDRWLVLLQGDQLPRASAGGLQTINAQGVIASFDRNSPDAEPWYFEAGAFGLSLDGLARLPFLILLRESRSPLLRMAQTRHLTLLDRRTGKPAVDPSGKPIDDLTMPGDIRFSSITMPHNSSYVELQSGTERLRLTVRNSE